MRLRPDKPEALLNHRLFYILDGVIFMAGKNDGKIRCSFCGKTQDQVERLISGPNNGVFICNECIDICAEIIDEEGFSEENNTSAKEDINLLKPEELKA